MTDIPPRNLETSSARPRSLAQKFKKGIGEEILRLAIGIANDVIPFEAHQIFFSWTDQSETLFHLADGFLGEADDVERLAKARALDSRLASNDSVQFTEDSRTICLVRVRLKRAIGHLALARSYRPNQSTVGTIPTCEFSKEELAHLLQVAQLIRGAAAKQPCLKLLRRLHISFVDCRTLMQEATESEILNEYLIKAAHVCDGVDLASLDPTRTSKNHQWKLRPTVKMVNDAATALRIAASTSSEAGEWTDERKQKLYHLPENGSEPDSIAAEVYLNVRSYRTNAYQTDPAPSRRTFSDTQSHISAPIVAGRMECLGVLSVETSKPAAYSSMKEAALNLLGGHLAWPLSRALQRQTFETVEHAFMEELWQLRSETREERLLAVLQKALIAVGYSRGLLSVVDYSAETVRGIMPWGGDRMEALCNETVRTFSGDAKDCQIRAVMERVVQNIRFPKNDERANNTAIVTGELTKPFAIYPVCDNHGRAIWTLHIERRDGAALSERDEKRVHSLCTRVMKAREELRRTLFEHSWYEEMIRTEFYSFNDVLRRFADSVVGRQIARRCRIFWVDESGQQFPFYEVGAPKAPDFAGVRLDERDREILSAVAPLLFVCRGFTTTLEGGTEFEVINDAEEHHLVDLANDQRGQWVEAPIRIENNLVAKVVFDHSGEHDTGFTLGELRLIARLTRMLSIGAEVAEAYKLIAGLCCAGLHGKLLWHFFRRTTLPLLQMSNQLDDTAHQEVEKIRDCLEAFRGVLTKKSKGDEDGSSSAAPTIGGEIANALKAIRPIAGDIDLPKIDAASYPQPVKAGDHSLFLVIVTLLENAVKCIKMRSANDTQALRQIGITIREDEQGTKIAVSDTGTGIEVHKADELKEAFADPVKYLRRGEEGGLRYAAFLAKEYRWTINLASLRNPTVFELFIPS